MAKVDGLVLLPPRVLEGGEGTESKARQLRNLPRQEDLPEGPGRFEIEGVSGTRRAILRVIERRFGEVPPDLRAEVEGISALPRLETLLDEAVTCASLAGFRKVLEER